MRIICPTCTAAYDVPDARIVPGGGVRCARCGEDWVPVQAAPVPPDLPKAPKLESMFGSPGPDAPAQDQPVPAPADRRGALVVAGWVLSVAVLGCLAWAAYAWRADIMRGWPPSQRLYAAFGLVGAAAPQ